MKRKYRRYTKEHVKHEAELFLSGSTLSEIAECTHTPLSTVSWHLIHPLYDYDIELYIKVRAKLLTRCKDESRRTRESRIVESYIKHHV